MRVFMFNRREFMAAGALAGAAVAASCTGCRRTDYVFLSAGDALALTAICDQIIPADDFPSASQAGVLTYIDRQLGHHYRRHQAAYREGLKQAELLSRGRFGVDLAHASAPQQLEVVRAIEEQNKAFFDLVRSHTMQGYYGSPRHGGNRSAVSWHMLGLDEPPVRGRAQYDFTAGSKR
jgi:gluconate 2-dehydrogenase gamma chain